ncbi:MAG: ferric reductase-like transmembrane domain-containing protein, partial [Dehalococcoidia bacterium]|nr:ferric reductase-like transmembrane domain-containing protein [Dehalococcoidia bacterium]
PWAISRASGLAAFAVLTASVVMGLLISTKASDGVLGRPFVFEMHQFLAVVSLVLIGVHAGSLLFDGFLHFTSLSLVVPFISPYRPVAVGVGVIAGWLVAITTASFWMRSRIGQKRWRTLHYVTFLAYVAGLGHGVFAGTDTQLPVVYWGYILSLATVTALTTLRIAGYKKAIRRAAPARPSTPAAAPSQVRA